MRKILIYAAVILLVLTACCKHEDEEILSLLQDQQAIDKSPIYKNLVRELQMTTFFEGEWVRVTQIPHDNINFSVINPP